MIGLATVLVVTAGAQAQETGREVLLKDQFGKIDGPGRHHGQAVLLSTARSTACGG